MPWRWFMPRGGEAGYWTSEPSEAGLFAFTVANTQPYTDVNAIDIDWSNFVDAHSHHGNIDFQTVDLNHPLPFHAGYFDVIHVKCMHLAVPYYHRLVERLARILAPGGMLILTETEPAYLSTNGILPSAIRQWNAAVREAYGAQGIDHQTPSSLLSYLSTTAMFATPAYHQDLGIPCVSFAPGPLSTPPTSPLSCWSSFLRSRSSEASRLFEVGHLHSQVIAANMRSMMPVLMQYGYGREDLETLLEDCHAALTGPGSTYYQRLFAVYATKIN